MTTVPRIADWTPLPATNWSQRQWDAIRDIPPRVWALIGPVLILIIAIKLKRLITRPDESVVWTLASMALTMFLYLAIGKLFSGDYPGWRLRKRVRGKESQGHLVNLGIARDGEPLGLDQGFVRFVDRALEYGGLETSFRLKPEDVFGPNLENLRHPGSSRFGIESSLSTCSFHLWQHPGIRITFFPLKGHKNTPVAQPLLRWMEERDPATGESVLPPLDRKPGFRLPRVVSWPWAKRAE